MSIQDSIQAALDRAVPDHIRSASHDANLGIKDEAKTRADLADDMLRLAGFSIERRLYVNGQTMQSDGYEKAARERKDFDALPLVGALCDGIVGQVGAEQRRDFPVNLGTLELLDSGLLLGPSKQATFGLETRGFASLANKLTTALGGADGSRYIADQLPPRRARFLNEHIKDIAVAKGKNAVLRTRLDGDGIRSVFAVVGPQFDRAIDTDVVASIVRDAIDGLGLRGEASYDGQKLLIKGFAGTPIEVKEHGVGEPFQAGCIVTTADDGSAALNIASVVLRRRCLNATVSTDKLATKIVHRTNETREQRVGKVRQAIVKAIDINPFVKAWAEADTDACLAGDADPLEKIKLLVKRGLVKTPAGSKADEVVNRIRKCWEMEPARYTRTALVNAITRAAHHFPWQSPWAQTQLEEDAGKLVYVHNLSLN